MKVVHYIWMYMLLSTCMLPAKSLVVSQEGKGDFTSIQAALASLSDSASEPRVLLIKKGIYREKIYIEKHNVVLLGDDPQKVIITAAVAREEWRCKHQDDWGVATLNVDGNDITLQNLTVVNSYGFENQQDRNIVCLYDSNQHKTITRTGHQMAVRTMSATRFKAVNCVFRSYAGDTMSPWNVEGGLFYFKDCIMEGGVDLYCPRGWAYAQNCKFIATRGEAVIWHDGSKFKDSKTVLSHCTFEGYKNFKLGRYHRDAQFYLVHCRFAENMSDSPIALVQTKNIIQWGHRVYYHDCHRIGGDYPWFEDNMASLAVQPKDIDAGWVFGDRWHPEK